MIRYSKTKDLNYCYGQYADIFDPIIETLIANGKGIEINTAGLDKGLKEQHPCTEFIRQYRKKGGEISQSAPMHTAQRILDAISTTRLMC